MTPAAFADRHAPALEADEVRHNLILGLLARARAGGFPAFRSWSLGPPGHCALQTSPENPIVLGGLDRDEAARLAEMTADAPWLGVTGPDGAPAAFAARAAALGVALGETMPQEIHALAGPPRPSGATGAARAVGAGDADLFAAWMAAFFAEAVPFEPVPPRAAFDRTAAGGQYAFWIDGGRPVAMAGVVRRLRRVAAVAGVYTPPGLRGRGYGAAVTAAVADRLRAEGRAACLYIDLRNAAARRAYAKVGFVRRCEAALILRAPPAP